MTDDSSRCVFDDSFGESVATRVRLPFTKRMRSRWSQNRLGHRPVNNWGDGDLPAPWAEGDIVRLTEEGYKRTRAYGESDRLRGMGPGHFVVVYACSIDDGDAWYFRVFDGDDPDGPSSDRLHVAFAARCSNHWTEDCDWMREFELVDTADPDGLALRESMLAEGWTLDLEQMCPTCGQHAPWLSTEAADVEDAQQSDGPRGDA